MSLDDIRARAREVEDGSKRHTIGQAFMVTTRSQVDVPDLLTALDAVLELHTEADGFCTHCGGRTDFVDYPCPTISAIRSILES